jgi:hypothetical protein
MCTAYYSFFPELTAALHPRRPHCSGGAEYFEVYAPEISTLYSQVFWTSLAPAPLPEWLVKKYANHFFTQTVHFPPILAREFCRIALPPLVRALNAI